MLHPPLFFVLFSFALQVRQSVKFVAAFKNQISYFFFFFKVMRSNIGVLTKKKLSLGGLWNSYSRNCQFLNPAVFKSVI